MTAKSRRIVASSAAVPIRMAPCRSRSSRSISALDTSLRSSVGSARRVARLISPTSSISVPYCGTSSRYMSDMAHENIVLIASVGTKMPFSVMEGSCRVCERVGSVAARPTVFRCRSCAQERSVPVGALRHPFNARHEVPCSHPDRNWPRELSIWEEKSAIGPASSSPSRSSHSGVAIPRESSRNPTGCVRALTVSVLEGWLRNCMAGSRALPRRPGRLTRSRRPLLLRGRSFREHSSAPRRTMRHRAHQCELERRRGDRDKAIEHGAPPSRNIVAVRETLP